MRLFSLLNEKMINNKRYWIRGRAEERWPKNVGNDLGFEKHEFKS